jgi:hypothetical protein
METVTFVVHEGDTTRLAIVAIAGIAFGLGLIVICSMAWIVLSRRRKQ